MGGDGGSIPGRSDVVRTAGFRFARNLGGMGYLPNTQVRAGSDKYNKSEERLLKWTRCSLTQEPLKPPIVACRLGQLYNKEALIHQLLQKKHNSLPSTAAHIESLKDVKDIVVEFDEKAGKLVCPILKIEFDSGVKGVIIWSCGCVISTKGLEQLSKKVSRVSEINHVELLDCPVCGKKYNPQKDVVQLVPDSEDILLIKQRLLEYKQQIKHSLKQRKRSNRNSDQSHRVESKICVISPTETVPLMKKRKLVDPSI